MRVYDCNDSDGGLIAFEVDNATLTRNRACRIAASIAGVEIVRRSRLFRDSDDFCEFLIDGETFIIEEPFGDNSRYWIGPKDSTQHKSLLTIREAFERHSTWHAGRLILIATALSITALFAYRCNIFLTQDSCLDRGGRWDRIQQVCSSATSE